MPGLLDLPPELIEQIYDSFADRVPVDEHHNPESKSYTYNKFEGRSLRLVNRYIQRATRHSFASTHFQEWDIRAFDYASIERFCAMTDVPDLAQCVEKIGLSLEEDRLMRVDTSSLHAQPAKIMIFGSKATRIFDDDFGADVPLTLFQNRKRLIKSFAACEQLWTLFLYNRCLSADCWLALGFAPGQTLPQNEILQLDISSSVSYILSLLEAASASPEYIAILKQPLHHQIDVGLTNSFALRRYGTVLSKVKTLRLDFLEDYRVPVDVAQELGLRNGENLTTGFGIMSGLVDLCLKFESGATGVAVWSMLATAPVLPHLRILELDVCDMNLSDYTTFVLRHVKTLRSLRSRTLVLRNGTYDELGSFYARMSELSKIRSLCLGHVFLDSIQRIRWPTYLCSIYYIENLGDEDDYVEVRSTELIEREGRGNVRNGLAEIAAFLINQ